MNPFLKKYRSILSLTSVFIILGIGSVLSSCGSSSSRNEDPSETQPSGPVPYPPIKPSEFHGEKNFAFLMNHYSVGKPDPVPWAGYWWPYASNGIAAGTFGGSPIGKYDAARGRPGSAQAWEVANHGAGVPNIQSWWGHCNGWCAAAALYPEPRQHVVVNGIDFGVGDIKALLTEAGMSAYADYFGERVDIDDESNPKYWDVVPDQYFLVLTNYIGKLKRTVLIDRYTGSQVWNQPLAGYRIEYPTKADYLGNSIDAPNVYRIELTSTIWWMNDNVAPDIQTPEFDFENSDANTVDSRTLRMEVWLDGPVVFDEMGKIRSSGNIIVTRQNDLVLGGAWRMGDGYNVDAWPDYMWIPYSLLKPSDPEQDFVNPEVEIDWIKNHILVPGGSDDLSVTPVPVAPAPPLPRPSGSPTPQPQPQPTILPFPEPAPVPTSPAPGPSPTDNGGGGGFPFPWWPW